MNYASKPLELVLVIVHSKVKHLLPKVTDEALAATVKPKLDKIEEGIESPKTKGLKTSKDKIKDALTPLFISSSFENLFSNGKQILET